MPGLRPDAASNARSGWRARHPNGWEGRPGVGSLGKSRSHVPSNRHRSLQRSQIQKWGPFLGVPDFRSPMKIHCLHRGRARRPIVRIIPDGILYRIEWPDIGLSDLTNLTRAKAAAREWAERQTMTEDRKLPVARRLKSLDNFWWSSSPVRSNERAAA